MKNDPVARGFIIEAFFSSHDPQLAESLYGLIRDADIKDAALIEDLIQVDSGKVNALTKRRIVDLIADFASTQIEAPYSAVIGQYLSQTAQSRELDPVLHSAVTAQLIWYQSRYQPDSLNTLAPYLLDGQQRVREEMYSMIDAHIANQNLSGQSELANAMDAALHDGRLNMLPDERARVANLLASIR